MRVSSRFLAELVMWNQFPGNRWRLQNKMGLYIDEPRMQIREERTAWTAAVLKIEGDAKNRKAIS